MAVNRAFLGLGSNVGDRWGYMNEAVREIAFLPGLRLLQASCVYETEPVGYTAQPLFLNAVLAVDTPWPAQRLLTSLLAVETAMGRTRSVRWGPRVIDIDLLLYGDEVLTSPQLTVPHPRLPERAFVLIPLAELAADLIVPGVNESVRNLLAGVGGKQGVKRVGSLTWPGSGAR